MINKKRNIVYLQIDRLPHSILKSIGSVTWWHCLFHSFTQWILHFQEFVIRFNKIWMWTWWTYSNQYNLKTVSDRFKFWCVSFSLSFSCLSTNIFLLGNFWAQNNNNEQTYIGFAHITRLCLYRNLAIVCTMKWMWKEWISWAGNIKRFIQITRISDFSFFLLCFFFFSVDLK